MTTGTASIRATSTGVELRQGRNRIRLYKHQLPAVADYLHDHWERLDAAAEQEGSA